MLLPPDGTPSALTSDPEERRRALQNAASVAGLLLTTEVMVAESPKDDGHKHGGGMPDMGGMTDMGM